MYVRRWHVTNVGIHSSTVTSKALIAMCYLRERERETLADEQAKCILYLGWTER